MLSTFVKRTLICLSLLSYAATSIAMEGPKGIPPANVSQHFSAAPEPINFALSSLRFWYAGIAGLKDVFSTPAWAANLPTIAQLNETMLSKEMIDMIKDTALKMNVPFTTKVGVHSSATGSSASASHNILLIDLALFNSFSADENAAVLGHEFSHIKHKDVRNESLFSLAAPFLSYAILLAYEKIMNYPLILLENKCLKNGKLFKTIQVLRVLMYVMRTYCMSQYLLTVFLVNKVSRSNESRSDRESALELGRARGMINFLRSHSVKTSPSNRAVSPDSQFLVNKVSRSNESHLDRESELELSRARDSQNNYKELIKKSAEEASKSMKWYQKLYVNLKLADSLLRMPAHPSDQDRIKDLEALETKK